jgi:putative flavoprotein involved in K+ transport
VGSAPRTARRYRGKDVVAWLDEMGHYRLPVDQHPMRQGVRDRSNHYVTGRDGGRDIDLRQRALEGMALYGRLTGVRGELVEVAGDLAHNLDQADAVAESIKNGIDKYIDAQGLPAPVEPRPVPVWEPVRPASTIDLAPISTVIWSTGYRSDYRWIELPLFDGRGYPCHQRGITPVVGVYFIGLPWLHTWGSGRFAAVAEDAEWLAAAIEARTQ